MASKGKKVLIGLGIGCGSLILLVVVLIAVFASWISRPGELLEPETLVGSDTRGFVEWTLSLEDPGTKEFVESFLEKTQGSSTGQTPLPKELEQILLGWQGKRNKKKMAQMFPLSVGWILAPGEEPQGPRLRPQLAGRRRWGRGPGWRVCGSRWRLAPGVAGRGWCRGEKSARTTGDQRSGPGFAPAGGTDGHDHRINERAIVARGRRTGGSFRDCPLFERPTT